MTRWVALLYSVVLSPSRRVTSADLLQLATAIGVLPFKTVLSTGNIIFDADATEADLTHRFEASIARDWGKPIPVLLRTADDWRALVAQNPFAEQSLATPDQVAVRVMRHHPPADLIERLSRHTTNAAFATTPRALWIASHGQLSQSPLQRAMGSGKLGPGTFRNASAIVRIAAALD